MKFIDITGKEISVIGSAGAGKLQEMVESLADSGITIAKAVYARNEYANQTSARNSLTQAVKSTRKPYTVHQKNGGLWLVRDF